MARGSASTRGRSPLSAIRDVRIGPSSRGSRACRATSPASIRRRTRSASTAGVSGKVRLLGEFVVAGIASWVIIGQTGTQLYVPFFSWIDGLWQLWDQPYRQCLHDKWAGTVVVKVGV